MKPALRQSQIVAYQKCPKCYYRRYIQKIEVPPTSKMTMGTTVDVVMNEALKAKMAGQMYELNHAIEVAAQDFENRKDTTEWDGDEFGTRKDDVVAAVKCVITEMVPHIEPIVVQADFKIETDLPFDYTGTIDYIDKERRVRDLKVTTRQGLHGYQISGEIQPAGYIFAAQHLFGCTDQFIYDRIARLPGKRQAEYKPLHGTVSARDIEKFWETAMDVWRAIQAGVFPRSYERTFFCDCKRFERRTG